MRLVFLLVVSFMIGRTQAQIDPANRVEKVFARWGALTKYTATVPEVIANKRMTVFAPGCNCAGEWYIIGYRMTFVSNQPMNDVRIDGTALTAEAIRVIQTLRPGDKIVFDEIRVLCRGCRVHEWPPFTIAINAP